MYIICFLKSDGTGACSCSLVQFLHANFIINILCLTGHKVSIKSSDYTQTHKNIRLSHPLCYPKKSKPDNYRTFENLLTLNQDMYENIRFRRAQSTKILFLIINYELSIHKIRNFAKG